MNLSLLLAATMIGGIGIAHSVIGERKLIGPLTAPDTRAGMLAKSGHARLVLRFAWHVTTIAWWGLAAVLLLLARQPPDYTGRGLIIVVAVTFLATGLACIGGGRRHWAWAVFLAIGGLAGAAAL